MSTPRRDEAALPRILLEDPQREPRLAAAQDAPLEPRLTHDALDLSEALDLEHTEVTLEGQWDERLTEVARLELLEERPRVTRLREVVGALEVRRVVETRTVQIPVELVSEYLVIEHVRALEGLETAQASVRLGLDEQTLTLEPGQSYRFELYREAAQVSKVAEVVEQVRLGKRSVRESQDLSVELGRERLVIEQSGEVTRFSEASPASPADGTAGSTVPGDRSSLPAAGLT